MARKPCLKDFYEKASRPLIGDNLSEDNCLCDFFIDFLEALASFKFRNSERKVSSLLM